MNKPNNNNSIQHENSTQDKHILSTITAYPEINQCALLHKETRYYDVWLCLREVYKHQGNCSLAEATNLVAPQFDITKGAVYKIINDGDGIFWNLNCKKGEKKTTIWLLSLEKVCHRYNIEKLYQSVVIDLKDRHSVQERRAGIYEASIVKQPKCRTIPISRNKILERTGISKATQLRYEKKWKACKEFNFMIVCELEGLTEEQQYSRILDHTYALGGEYRVKKVHGKKVLLKQIPNIYYNNNFAFSNKGTLIRLNKNLRKSGDKMAPGNDQIHPYKNSENDKLFKNINIWSGKITLTFPL